MDDQATSWIHSYPSHEEPLVSSKGREDISEGGGSFLKPDGSQSSITSKSKELQDELESFMENVGKSADQKQELKKGFYTGGAEDLLPRHHIDDDDFRRHRTTQFPHVHHPLRIHTRPLPVKRDRGSHSPRSKSKKKSAEFTPSLPEVQESYPKIPVEVAEVELTEPTAEEDIPADVQATGDTRTADSKVDTVDDDKAEALETPENAFEPPFASTGKKEGEAGDSMDGLKPGFFIGDIPEEEQLGPTEMPISDPGQFNPGFMADGGQDDLERKGSSKVSFHLGPKDGSDTSMTATTAASTATTTATTDKPSTSTKPPAAFTVNYSGKPHHHHHHKHKHRRHSKASTKDLIDRRHLGSEVQLNSELRRIPTETDEAAMLSGLDLDEMTSHRFGETRGLRRRKHSTHSAMASIVHISKSDKGDVKKVPSVTPSKSKFDHSPHELFVELDELYLGDNAEFEWKEKSRWIKFEEDVEEGAERWGKPHVASLSFHSLLELRKCIEQGSILLDLEAEDLGGIVTRITEQLVTDDLLNPESKGTVISTLLLKHTHVSGGHQNFIKRNFSSTNLSGMERNSSTGSFRSPFFRRRASSPAVPRPAEIRRTNSMPESNGKAEVVDIVSSHGEVKIEMDGIGNSHQTQDDEVIFSKPSENIVPSTTVPANLHHSHSSSHQADILKKIPKGAEATTVLVGSADFLEKPIMAFVRLSEGRLLGNLTEVPLPVRFIFILMGPSESSLDYHEIGRSISTLLANTKFHDVAYRADGRQDLLGGINEFLDDSLVMPPGYWDKATLLPAMQLVREKEREKQKLKDQLEAKKAGGARGPGPPDDPLKRTGCLFGGVVNDVKRRYPKYWSDIKDGFNAQCLATIFFIYFAALSPAITFGGLLGEKTEKYIGVSEMLVGVSVSGLLFSLLGGQPILIIGFTGPILVFEESLYQFCDNVGLGFMAFRCWVCFWLAIISTVVVALEGSFLVRYFSRFTEEIFASLISIIFIYEVFKKLYIIFQDHPLKESYPPVSNVANGSLYNQSSAANDSTTDPTVAPHNGEPNTALLSLILTMGTFLLAYALKAFRNSQFLGRSGRRAIGDFGIPIAIFVMVLIDFLIEETYTEKLDVPDGLSPTDSSKRGWFINPMGEDLPVWAAFAAVIPALLVFILIFMETEITSLIVNKSERKMKKGTGYHLDMFIIGLFAIFCGILGLPMLCAATVRSVTHVSALTVFSRNMAPGEKPQLEGVLEQRVTGVLVHILIGVSVLMGPILRHVPLAVLFGVFLYMGVASMSGIQLFERIELIFKPVKHHPDVGYVRRVRTFKMHLFTAIQMVCLAILWAIKSTQAALSFPFALILTVPLRRFGLPLLYTEKELHHLDKGDEESEADLVELDEGEPDFYRQAHMPY